MVVKQGHAKRMHVVFLCLFFGAVLAACAQVIGIEPLPPLCGDGVVQPPDERQPGEACDDGNTVSGDGCNDTCLSNETCGNWYRDPGEVCDRGGNSTDCDADCTVAVCGDGFVNDVAGERCEDGNTVAGDGCISCLLECGNGVVDPNEICDAGDQDDDGYPDETATCDGDCTLRECGDEYVNEGAGEECDDGNDSNADACVVGCIMASCGDGFLSETLLEQCDDGDRVNGDDCPDGVGGTCQPARCGDGFVNAEEPDPEECDNGDSVTAVCDIDCTAAVCGDGYHNVAAGEQCDDGTETSRCDTDCTFSTCGDGHLNMRADEDCDEGGGGVDTVTCDADCTEPYCGDGHRNPAVAEQCDDGNSANGDGCSSTCQVEPAPP